ncbi:hypothetical protein BLS_004662 [Venturia inaequalis]|uniref:Uncharacterized protein n=1 Tax=Venturia inaequalis TaxID=5025 RepID=A0A8H3UWI0_VENIN|nr:hypothetical protein BLS_004662 [Venturia inaequalis]KAE9977954.1 hypothetical protein EG328_001747 [Venturia inaequalis]
MAVLTAPQPSYIATGQTIAAAALAEAGYNASDKSTKKNNRKAPNAKPKAEPPVVKYGEGHPDLVGRQYKTFTKEDHTKNFEWRKNNKCCTECGSSDHKYRKCEIREKKIRKNVASKEYNFHMQKPIVQDPKNPFLSIPRELRDQILVQRVGEYREAISDTEDTFTIQPDRKFLPAIFKVCFQLSEESCELLVSRNTFIIRSGRAMKFLQRFLKDHHIAKFVRSLEFPSFHWFNPGQAYPKNRHGPGGVYSMVSGDVVLMQLCSNLQKVHISLDVSANVNGEAYAYSVPDFITRYNLDQVVNCTHLTELVLELTDRHGYASGLQPGQDVWSNGEDLAQLFRDRMAGRVETELRAQFKVKKEAAKKKAQIEKHEYKVDEVEEQTVLARTIADAKTTSVVTWHITSVRQ